MNEVLAQYHKEIANETNKIKTQTTNSRNPQ